LDLKWPGSDLHSEFVSTPYRLPRESGKKCRQFRLR